MPNCNVFELKSLLQLNLLEESPNVFQDFFLFRNNDL